MTAAVSCRSNDLEFRFHVSESAFLKGKPPRGCFLGRIQKPFRRMHAANFEEMKYRRGFAHRMLLALARPISTKVILQESEAQLVDPWAHAFIQKGLQGSCVVLPNAAPQDGQSFPPDSLGDAFVAAFVGANGTDLSTAQFGRIHKEEFSDQADYMRRHNAVYRAAHVR